MPTCLREIFPARRQFLPSPAEAGFAKAGVLAGEEDGKLVEKIKKRLPYLFVV